MSDAFKDVSTVPTLTLEPFQAEEEKPVSFLLPLETVPVSVSALYLHP